jgi:hypothetical protein
MIRTETTVHRFAWTRYSRRSPKGSGSCEEQGQYYAKIKKWKWRGITLWKREIDREEIPNHVWISWGALGFDDSSWKSRLINEST